MKIINKNWRVLFIILIGLLFIAWRDFALVILATIAAGYIIFKTGKYIIKISFGFGKLFLSLIAFIFAIGILIYLIQ